MYGKVLFWRVVGYKASLRIQSKFFSVILPTFLEQPILKTHARDSGIFCNGKTVARTQSLIEFQNLILITKHFQKFLLLVFPNIYYHFQFDQVLLNHSER